MNRLKNNRNQPSSMPCPRCRRLISSSSERCIHCGYLFPRATASIPLLGELIREQLHFSNSIIVACAALYLLAIGLDLPAAFRQSNGVFNLFSPSFDALQMLGIGGYYPLMTGRWWTLLTATYLHSDVLHILFNMLWLRQLGPLVEDLYGPSRFFSIYTLAGVGGALVSALLGKTLFFVGASGAVFGLFGALIYYGLRRGGTFGTSIFRQIALWAFINLVFGFTSSGIDNWGHLGGLVIGALTAIALGYQEQRRQLLWHHVLTLLTLLFTFASFGFMVVYFFIR